MCKKIIFIVFSIISFNAYSLFTFSKNQKCKIEGFVLKKKYNNLIYFAFDIGSNSETRTHLIDLNENLIGLKVEVELKILENSNGKYFHSELINLKKLNKEHNIKTYNLINEICNEGKNYF